MIEKIHGAMSQVISIFETILSWFFHVFIYIFLYFLNHGHSLEEIKTGSFKKKQPSFTPPKEDQLEFRLSEIRRSVADEKTRESTINEKFKILLTINGFMLTVCLFAERAAESPVLTCLSITSFLVSAFLIVFGFRLGKIAVCLPEDVDWTRSKETAIAVISKDELFIRTSLEGNNDFRAGILRASQRAILIGICFLAIALSSRLYEQIKIAQDKNNHSSIDANIYSTAPIVDKALFELRFNFLKKYRFMGGDFVNF